METEKSEKKIDNEDVTLPSDTLEILNQFYSEEEQKRLKEKETKNFEEDWQLSQFWYDEKTANTLGTIALLAAGNNGKIVCISCPTVYKKIKDLQKTSPNENEAKVLLLEHDLRFECYNEEFLFYDYNEPLNLPENLKGQFDVVLADPPFLSRECLEKVAQTIKFLTKDKIILCTGAVMEDIVADLLGLHSANFKPTHEKKLANEFKCFSNYELDNFNA